MRLNITTVGTILATFLVIVASACSGTAGPASAPTTEPTARATLEPATEPAPDNPPNVVTTSNILADWVTNVGGDHVEVTALLPIGADPHVYQPGARDVARVADADLVLSIGAGLEEAWLVDLIRNAARQPDSLIELADVVDPIEFGDDHAEEVGLIEDVAHVVHEVEDGEIDAPEGLKEIAELLTKAEAMEGHGDEGDHHEGEEHEEEGDHHEGEEHEEEGDHHEGEEHEEEGDHHEGEEHEEEGDHHEGEEHEEEGDHHEGEEHGEEGGHGHGDEEFAEAVAEVLESYQAGLISAEEAIESLEELTEEGEDAHAGHGHGLIDPHFWFDPIRVKIAVAEIARLLSSVAPGNADVYSANAASYSARLDELHSWTLEQVAELPPERRLLVTSHESLGYFALLYEFKVVGVILSFTTDVEATAEDLATLVDSVERYQVPAVFGETIVADRLARSLAEDTGAEFVTLYSGSLGGDGSGASTYLDMARINVNRIVEALK